MKSQTIKWMHKTQTRIRWVKCANDFFLSQSVFDYNKNIFLFSIKNFENIFKNESRTSSSHKETDFETNRTKRFDFLLKQTEIFSHFMPGSNSKTGVTPEKKKKVGRKKDEEKQTTDLPPVDPNDPNLPDE